MFLLCFRFWSIAIFSDSRRKSFFDLWSGLWSSLALLRLDITELISGDVEKGPGEFPRWQSIYFEFSDANTSSSTVRIMGRRRLYDKNSEWTSIAQNFLKDLHWPLFLCNTEPTKKRRLFLSYLTFGGNWNYNHCLAQNMHTVCRYSDCLIDQLVLNFQYSLQKVDFYIVFAENSWSDAPVVAVGWCSIDVPFFFP